MGASVIRVDGREVEFRPGETVLQVTRRLGLQVPTLCWDERLDPAGSCRMCLVRVKGRPLPAASCTLRAEPGMEIETAPADIVSTQKSLLQMVLSENPDGECPRCRDVGPCELHDLARRLNVRRDRFLGRQSGAAKPDPNPFLARDYDRCILCYRCTRICSEVQGDHAISPAGRGFDTRIATAFDRGLMESPCTLCGQCIHTCPTGALSDRKMAGAGADGVPVQKTRTICTYCGTGCSLYLHSKGGRVIGVTPDMDGPANRGSLCVKGQFGFDFLNSPHRLTRPLLRENGGFREATWDEALSVVSRRLQEIKERYGPRAFYAIASGRAPGEAAYLLQKFTRAVMGSNQVDNCSRA